MARKTSPRTKQVRTISAASAALKAKWADPVWRAELIAKRNAVKYSRSRVGVPDGIRKRDALPLWERAREKAKRFIELMEDAGEVEKVVIPGSEADMAKRALEEAFTIAVSPMADNKIKVAAQRLVLDFTKKKPESASKLTLENSDEWLNILAADMKPKDGNGGTE